MQYGNVAQVIPHKRAKQSGWDMAKLLFFELFLFLQNKGYVWNLIPVPAGRILRTDDQGEEVFL